MADHSVNFLYSINTLLAYNINERYYKGSHYVWCSLEFDAKSNPPSANPREILYSFINDVANGDRHSPKIEKNRAGLLNGVEAKFNAGIIDVDIRNDLLYIINTADITYFRPVIYVINRRLAAKKLIQVSAASAASLFSQEYIIQELKTSQFDIIELKY